MDGVEHCLVIYDRSWMGTPNLNMNGHLTTTGKVNYAENSLYQVNQKTTWKLGHQVNQKTSRRLGHQVNQKTSWRLGHQVIHKTGRSIESGDEQGPGD